MDRSGSGSSSSSRSALRVSLQGSGLGSDAPARGQDVGDVLGAEGLQLQPVVERAHDGLLAVQLGQGEDLAQVHAGVHAFGFEPLEIGLGAWGQRQELHHQALFARASALRQQLLLVVWVFDVLVAIHAARMARDELVAVIDAHAIRAWALSVRGRPA
jgi:hypothetical protein